MKTQTRGFTLIELLTVIAIIAVLMGLLFPAIGAAREAARKAQAKNDMLNIINAIKAYQTDYGKYPCAPNTGTDNNQDYAAGDDNPQNVLMDILRALGPGNTNTDTFNPRKVVYLDAPISKNPTDPTGPKSGIAGNGRFYDPWGSCYHIRIDSNYDNRVINPYNQGAGLGNNEPLTTGVIAWSIGKDKKTKNTYSGIANKALGDAADDVLSWQ